MVIRWTGYTITVFLSILLGWYIVNPFLAEKSAASLLMEGFERAIFYSSDNAQYHYLLGRCLESDLNNPSQKTAISSFKEALRLNPTDGYSWIALARTFETLGMEKEADEALSRAIRISPNNPSLRWEAGLFYILNKRIDDAFQNFRAYIILDPEKQELVYDLCERLGLEKGYVLNNLIPPSYKYLKGYLFYLISRQNVEEAKNAWTIISKGQEKVEKELYMKYTDLLIGASEYDEARKVWNSFLADSDLSKEINDDMPWNGSFEHDSTGGGFDWKIGKEEGVRISVDNDVHREGARSLAIVFDGEHNPNLFAASQVVLLKPETDYTLKGYIRTENITTTNGIFIDIIGLKDQDFHKATDALTGTNSWTELKIGFRTPPECYAGVIRVRRMRSVKLNNKIGGNAWVDRIILREGKITDS